MSSPDAVILSACRTGIGTARRGTLADVSAFDLADVAVRGAVQRAGLPTDLYDDIALAESMYGGGVIARHAALTAGMAEVPGFAINRHCASGLAAIELAAATIRAGMADLMVAGGVYSSSTRPVLRWRVPGSDEWADRWMSPSHPDSPDAPNDDMPVTVGWNTARLMGFTREEMDAWALRSHQRAVAAIDDGKFREEIVPVEVRRRDGPTVTFAQDEHPRRDTSLEKLAALRPLHPEIEGFSITAGNSSGVNDAAAALTVASGAVARAHGLTPLAVVRSWASAALPPAETGMTPTLAVPKALKRAGLSLGDVDLVEINEAFASTPMAACEVLGIDESVMNVNGSGCSLGHPISATGARMAVTMIYELRRRGGGIGVIGMCAAGGMGSAAVLEVPAP